MQPYGSVEVSHKPVLRANTTSYKVSSQKDVNGRWRQAQSAHGETKIQFLLEPTGKADLVHQWTRVHMRPSQ